MRYSHVALLALASGLTLSAAGPKDVTYLQGSLDGISAETKATLDLTNTKVMVLRSGSAKFEIPYLAISKSDSKPQVAFHEPEPMYKVWTLRKKLLPPTPLEEVTLEYNDAKGGSKTLTLSMEQGLAEKLSARLAQAEQKKAERRGEWWGDSVWKTPRNQQAWGGAGEMAAR